MNDADSSIRTLRGSCHCGAVRFKVQAAPAQGASRCNCTVCTKLAVLGSIVKPDAFELLTPDAEMGEYRWGSKMATRYFCKVCGTHCFGKGHLPALGGDFVSFNYNVIDELEISELPVVYWDGRHNNWQAGTAKQPWPIGVTTPPMSPEVA